MMDKVRELPPKGGNLCLTSGACASGCPATGLGGGGHGPISAKKILKQEY